VSGKESRFEAAAAAEHAMADALRQEVAEDQRQAEVGHRRAH
jgi:hypothetical protein